LKHEFLSIFLGVIAAFAVVSLTTQTITDLNQKILAAEIPAPEMPIEKSTYEGKRIETEDLIDYKSTKNYEYLVLPISFLAAILIYRTTIKRLG
jgi:hypothetical protein